MLHCIASIYGQSHTFESWLLPFRSCYENGTIKFRTLCGTARPLWVWTLFRRLRNGMSGSKEFIETGVEPRINLTLVSRDAALKVNAGLAMLVVPDDRATCANCLSSSWQEQRDLNRVPW